jgi:aspartoacylase
MSNKISQVTIVGGIHGNELLGVYLIKKFGKFPQLIERPSFNTTTLLANPQAILFRKI